MMRTVLASLVLLAACGGSKEGPNEQPAPSPAAPATEEAAAPAGEGEAAAQQLADEQPAGEQPAGAQEQPAARQAAAAADSPPVVTWDTQMGRVTFEHARHLAAGRSCEDCHPSPFTMKAHTLRMTMADINAGRACGRCHDGQTAFAASECGRCHAQ